MIEEVKPKKSVPTHLVLRFSDAGLDDGGTIRNHKEILAKQGTVAMGKYGKPIGTKMIRKLNDQIAEETETYVFLVQSWAKKRKSVFVGNVTEICRTIEKKDLRSVPSYYRQKANAIQTWIKINHLYEVDNKILGSLALVNTGNRAPSALASSMAGIFYVRFNKGVSLADYIP